VQTRHGNMLLGQMTHITPGFSDAVSPGVIPDSAHEALRMFPQLRHARILRSWRSPAPFTPDHMPLVGRVAVYDNLLMGSGFACAITQAPWAGEFLAGLAAGDRVPPAASVFDPLRFGAVAA